VSRRSIPLGAFDPTREVLRPDARNFEHGGPLPAAAGPFGPDVDPGDSERLQRLREIIDTEIGWANQADEEGGDYERRLHEVALELKRLTARDLSMRDWLRTLLAKVDALLNGPAVVDFDEAAKRAREAEERR
jgi:hypothetical protein